MEREYRRSRRRENINTSTDQLFMRTIRRAICSMLLCTACLVSSTWAWFVSASESHVSVIRLGETTVTVSQESSTFSRRSSVRTVGDGEALMPAGEYIISVEPNSGTSPMYCLIEVESMHSGRELAEEVIDQFNEDLDEEWIPVYASDSNAIRIVDEEELETFIEEFEEDNEELEYEILPIAVVSSGTYRVDWESGEERTFSLNLKQDALVKMEVFWLTEDEAEDDYPNLEELMGWKYVLVYSTEKASPSDAIKSTQAVEPTKPVETMPTTAPATTPSEGAASAGTATESSSAATETTVPETTETAETTAAGTESTEATTEAPTTEAVTQPTTAEAEPTQAQEPEPPAAEAEPPAEQETEPEETEPETPETDPEEVIPADMSTEEIESMGEDSPVEE